MRAAPLALILFAAPALSPAWAQDRPPAMQPTRDVTVTYRTGSGQTMRMAWQVAANRMRMDMPAQSAAVIVDIRAQTAIMVMEQRRMALRVAFDPATLPFNPAAPDATTHFTRQGTATILGLACTNWRMEGGPADGAGCITADGVMLRGISQTASGASMVEATEVSYGPQDPARFEVPPGFQTVDIDDIRTPRQTPPAPPAK